MHEFTALSPFCPKITRLKFVKKRSLQKVTQNCTFEPPLFGQERAHFIFEQGQQSRQTFGFLGYGNAPGDFAQSPVYF